MTQETTANCLLLFAVLPPPPFLPFVAASLIFVPDSLQAGHNNTVTVTPRGDIQLSCLGPRLGQVKR